MSSFHFTGNYIKANDLIASLNVLFFIFFFCPMFCWCFFFISVSVVGEKYANILWSIQIFSIICYLIFFTTRKNRKRKKNTQNKMSFCPSLHTNRQVREKNIYQKIAFTMESRVFYETLHCCALCECGCVLVYFNANQMHLVLCRFGFASNGKQPRTIATICFAHANREK